MNTRVVNAVSRVVRSGVCGAILSGLAATVALAADYKIDPSHTSVGFKVKHLAIASVPGKFVDVKGSFSFDPAKIESSKAEAAVTDIKDAETNANLVNHLKSPDFFEVAKFPDANFEVTSVTAKADKATGNTHVVNGKMTIKGIAQDVSFPAKVTGTDASLTINGTLVLDRSKFDIRFGSETFFGSLGDKAISNDMKLVVNLIANKK